MASEPLWSLDCGVSISESECVVAKGRKGDDHSLPRRHQSPLRWQPCVLRAGRVQWAAVCRACEALPAVESSETAELLGHRLQTSMTRAGGLILPWCLGRCNARRRSWRLPPFVQCISLVHTGCQEACMPRARKISVGAGNWSDQTAARTEEASRTTKKVETFRNCPNRSNQPTAQQK